MRNKILAVLILALLSCVAAAQTTTIKGKVLDREGKPMEGAKVTFKSLDDGTKYEIKVNKKGEYFSLGIKPGSYNVVLSKDGQSLFTLNKVPVTFDETHNVFDIDLRKEQGAATPGQKEVSVPEAVAAQSGGVSTDDAAQQAPATGASGAAAPPRDPNAPIVLTEEQQKKLTPEQKKEYEEYQKALKENSKIKGLNGILQQAQAAAKGGNLDEAIRLVQGTTVQDPNRALLWAILGQYQADSARTMTDRAARTQRFGESATAFGKALELQAAAPDAKGDVASWRVGYGSALDGSGKYDDAVKAFATAAQEAATSNPKMAALAHYNTGLVLAKTGKVEEAAAEFDKAVQLDPTLTEAYYQKGTALIAKATTDKAGKIVAPPGTEEAFEKYLEVAPNGRNVESATAQLQFLGAKVKTSVRNK
jgi:tetratricopeptide (TPR) repeat protein